MATSQPWTTPDNEHAPVLLSLIIPMYNEEENVAELVRELDAVLPTLPGRAEVLCVDDASGDRSWAILRELSNSRPWLRGLRLFSHRGQTAAISAGLAAARGQLIAFMDADLQNDPRDLGAMMAPVLDGEADVVCGWRRKRQDNVVTRTVPSMLANSLIRWTLGLTLHDVGCSLKVFRREYLEDVHLFGEMHRFLPAFVHAQGARIREVPVEHRPRTRGASKYGLGRVGKVLVDLLTVKLLNSYGASPAYLFGKIAALFFAVGTVFFGVVCYRAFALQHVEATPLIFMMLLMYITALMALMSGLLAELNIRVLHQVGGQSPYRVIETIGQDAETKR